MNSLTLLIPVPDTLTDMVEIVEDFGNRYYTKQEYRKCCLNGNLSIFHQNVISFCQNFDQLSVFLRELGKPIDIIVLTETWFSDVSCSDILGYTAYHTYRVSRAGGGVSICDKDELISHYIQEKYFVSEVCEACVVEVIPEVANMNQTLIICGIYRPPNSHLPEFMEFVDNSVGEYSSNSAIFIGDFNIDIVHEELIADFVNVMYSHSLFPLITIPTWVTESTAKCLDHIWYNRFNVSHCGAFVTDISDHYLIFCILTITVNKSSISKKIRDHSDVNVGNLIDNLSYLSSFVSVASNLDVRIRIY